MGFHKCLRKCEDQGGSLACVRNDADNSFLDNLMMSDGDSQGPAFIGLTDQLEEAGGDQMEAARQGPDAAAGPAPFVEGGLAGAERGAVELSGARPAYYTPAVLAALARCAILESIYLGNAVCASRTRAAGLKAHIWRAPRARPS